MRTCSSLIYGKRLVKLARYKTFQLVTPFNGACTRTIFKFHKIKWSLFNSLLYIQRKKHRIFKNVIKNIYLYTYFF